jgi:hypothetical protein
MTQALFSPREFLPNVLGSHQALYLPLQLNIIYGTRRKKNSTAWWREEKDASRRGQPS